MLISNSQTCHPLFREEWQHESIRHISIACSNLVDDSAEQLDMFDTQFINLKKQKLDSTVDEIRKRYGFTSVVKLSSKVKGATAIERAGLVGGHAGGNAYE